MWTTHSTEPAVQPHQRNGSTHVPAGTSWRSDTERDPQFYSYAAAPTARSKNSPVLSIACIVTASFRATATAARLNPTLSLNFRPHVRKPLSADVRVRMTVAASNSRPRK